MELEEVLQLGRFGPSMELEGQFHLFPTRPYYYFSQTPHGSRPPAFVLVFRLLRVDLWFNGVSDEGDQTASLLRGRIHDFTPTVQRIFNHVHVSRHPTAALEAFRLMAAEVGPDMDPGFVEDLVGEVLVRVLRAYSRAAQLVVTIGVLTTYVREEGRQVPLAAAESSSRAAAASAATEENAGAVCVICLEEMGDASWAVALPCSHSFHGQCISSWLERGHSCPVCRWEMPAEV